jgi:hypothetical protein
MALTEGQRRPHSSVGDETCDRCGQTLGAEAAERAAESFYAEAPTRR